MALPHLTFWCELDANATQALFEDPRVVEQLRAIDAGLSLALLDLSAERAAVVNRLNEAGIPVTAWLLVPHEQGYYFNLGNATDAQRFYVEFRAWTTRHGLRWDGVGLDIEPDIRELRAIAARPAPVILTWLARLFDGERLRRGQAAYRDLVARIRADGYRVESYQFPSIIEERRTGATLLQRLMGVVDVGVDREVLMLYSSFLGGPGTLWSYAPDAGAIGAGSTGGGTGDALPKLTWDELARDLRLARRQTGEIYVFSLEGCVREGFLERLAGFDWDAPVDVPTRQARLVNRLRSGLRAVLWTSAHPAVLLAVPVLLAIVRRARRK